MTSITAREELGTSADVALIRRAGRGDVAAFDALVATRLDRCYRLAWSILGNDADAADATQDAFLAAWRQLPRLRDLQAFDGWLNRIVANAARMARRHRVRLREVQVESANTTAPVQVSVLSTRPDPSPSAFDAVAERDAIGRAFDRLRPDERAILTLHHVDERPVVEIARSLGIPVGTAKWRLHSARRALERALEAEA
ncbi:MAG TPA: RNA polymerase sigma factor [Candidatus Limnocylindrales bacterium]|nr:RNA polymerase sigma factor [Candidatus Limnocylindrales bacterium]